ncbi:MAG: glutamate-cysteine ligase family protein [Thermoanaerobaculia bacterium]|nr:glutamate-cysteine ligase family protein [Thermoanaerobaculia bacterium]
MGEEVHSSQPDSEELRRFTQRLLVDLRVLEEMIERGLIESGVHRIGAEQEMFLVDRSWRPALLATELLAGLDDERFTTELGRFNLEANLYPVSFEGRCFSDLETQLQELLGAARMAAARHDAEILLVGILPTLEKSDLTLDAMTPRNRYRALNEAMKQLRGEEFQFRIKGRDELLVRHDNVMLEACNTSFQVHLQVGADDFARLYNIAQLIAAPVLAATTNSPLLFGRRLWAETRIALFQQSVDTRRPGVLEHRHQQPRVSFGRSWIERSVVEIFQEDIARFRVVLGRELGESSLDVLRGGGVPELTALRLHNGTVYRWNRPCYGLSEGRPHLRIENRVLPAGPSVSDEIANAAFWLGLMVGAAAEYGDPAGEMPFEVARDNFVAAARLGLRSQLGWIDDVRRPAQQLIVENLVPLARKGLERRGVAPGDIERYLTIVEQRVERGATGAHWQVESLDNLENRGTRSEVLAALAASMHEQQLSGKPVHSWDQAGLDGRFIERDHFRTVGQLMSTDLFTVNEDEPVDLAAHLMDWRHVRHVPVENADNRLVGLVSHRSLLRRMARALAEDDRRPVLIRDIMAENVLTVRPETSTREAIAMMKQHHVSCLPVVDREGCLVGIITERDFMGIAGRLLDSFLAENGADADDGAL